MGTAADEAPLPRLPLRDRHGHKGTFGTVAVVGGCAERARRMIGAPALAALGALRAGAGLAQLIMPEPILNHAIGICPAATGAGIPVDEQGSVVPHEGARVLDERLPLVQCSVAGPGLGTGDGPRALMLRCIQQQEIPVVVDADGLNCLAEIPELWRDLHAAAIMTPHPGEYQRLAGALKIGHDPIRPETRAAAAEALAQRLGCIVVLKGAGTVVSDGQRTWASPVADPVLATGGTGDVLAGVIAGLVAQFVGPLVARPMPRPANRPLDLFEAAQLGVHIHGLAAAQWKERARASAGMMPQELADCIPEAMQGMAYRD